jgi:hypothetical protein
MNAFQIQQRKSENKRSYLINCIAGALYFLSKFFRILIFSGDLGKHNQGKEKFKIKM